MLPVREKFHPLGETTLSERPILSAVDILDPERFMRPEHQNSRPVPHPPREREHAPMTREQLADKE